MLLCWDLALDLVNFITCTLQLVETMVKNCGDYVHFQITERAILQEMIKIVKKKVKILQQFL